MVLVRSVRIYYNIFVVLLCDNDGVYNRDNEEV